MIARDQALAAAAEGLAVLATEKQQTGGDPTIDAQLDALLDAAFLIASDIPDHR